VRYFVSGGGGSALYPRAPRPSAADQAAVRYFERVHHYLRVHVYGDLVEITAVRADGTPIETVAWGAPPRIEAPRPPAIASPAVVPTVGGASRDTSGLGAWGGRLAAALVLGAIFVLWRALRG